MLAAPQEKKYLDEKVRENIYLPKSKWVYTLYSGHYTKLVRLSLQFHSVLP